MKCMHQMRNNFLAAADSGHAFSDATRWRFDTPVTNSFDYPTLKMVAVSFFIPKYNPKSLCGDNGHFISAETQTVGVADGDGGWWQHGIDGGEYPRRLMHNSLLALQENPHYALRPKMVLEEAYAKTDAQGSSTACIVSLSSDNVLRAANVGDSRFLVVRDGNVFYRSPTQQRSFNNPYQLGRTKDGPNVAKEIEVRVKKGDTLVVGTGGLFDNVHEWEITEMVRRGKAEGKGLADQCSCMAKFAQYSSFHKYRVTPFSMAGKLDREGKEDDISVIMATIT